MILNVSSPPQPIKVSLPAPPLKVSSPAPPINMSFPDVPLRVCASVDVDCKSAAVTFDELMPVKVNKRSEPFLIRVLLPLEEITKLDELIDVSKPIESVPSVKSLRVSESDDEVITITSLPAPEIIVSFPVPPSSVSSPASPYKVSSPARH